MDENLVIDDDYVQDVGDVCARRGKELEEILSSYLEILDTIKSEALMEGDISSALETFNECASAISGQLEKISSQVQDVCGAFIVEVNDADSYLF